MSSKKNYGQVRDTQLNDDIQYQKFNKEYTYDYETVLPHERPESIKKISPKKGYIQLTKKPLSQTQGKPYFQQQYSINGKPQSANKLKSPVKSSKKKASTKSTYVSPQKVNNFQTNTKYQQNNNMSNNNNNQQTAFSRVYIEEINQSQIQKDQQSQQQLEKQRQLQIYRDYVMNQSQSQSNINNSNMNMNNISALNNSRAMNTSQYDKVGKLHESRSSWVSPTKSPIKYIKYENVVLHNKSREQMRDLNCDTLNKLLSSDNLFNEMFQGKKIKGKKNLLSQSKSQNQFGQMGQVLDQSLINNNYHNQQNNSNIHSYSDLQQNQTPRNNGNGNNKQYYLMKPMQMSNENTQQTQQSMQSTLQFLGSPRNVDQNGNNKSLTNFSNLSTINKNHNIDNSNLEASQNPLQSTIKMNGSHNNISNSNQSFQSFSVNASPRKRVSIKSNNVNKQVLENKINESMCRDTAYEREWVQDIRKELNTSVSRLQNGKICVQDLDGNLDVVTTDLTNQRILNRINYLKNNEGLTKSQVKILNKSTKEKMENTIEQFDQNASIMRSNLYGNNQEMDEESRYCNLNETLNRSTNRLQINSDPAIVKEALNIKCPHLVEKAMYCTICNRKIISQPQTYQKNEFY